MIDGVFKWLIIAVPRLLGKRIIQSECFVFASYGALKTFNLPRYCAIFVTLYENIKTHFKDKTEKMPAKFQLNPAEDDGLSAINLSNSSSKNKRIATRYVRNDITIALCEITSLSFGKEVFLEFVTLNLGFN